MITHFVLVWNGVIRQLQRESHLSWSGVVGLESRNVLLLREHIFLIWVVAVSLLILLSAKEKTTSPLKA